MKRVKSKLHSYNLLKVGSKLIGEDVHDVVKAVRQDDATGIRWCVLGYDHEALRVLDTGHNGLEEMAQALSSQSAELGPKTILHAVVRAKNGTD